MIKFGVLCRLSNSLRSECLKNIEKDWIQSFASLIIFISSFYSFVMGIVLALLFVLTDSIWPCILFHFANNAMAPVAALLEENYGEAFVSRYVFPFSRGLSDSKSAAVTVTAAIAGLVITVLCLRAVARIEGREDLLRSCIRGSEKKGKLITPSLIIAIVLMAIMTVAVCYSLIMHLTVSPS